MKRHHFAVALLAAQISGIALAQPADLPVPAAVSNEFPSGITTAKVGKGTVYVDAQGRTLYGLDLRAIVDRTANGAKYCQGPCLEEWEPVLAPAGAQADATIGANPLASPALFGGAGGAAQARAAQGAGAAAAAPAPAGAAPGQGGGQQRQGDGGLNIIGSTAGTQGPVSDWSVVEGPKGPQWVYKRWHLVFVRKGDKPGQTDRDGHDNLAWNTLKYVPPAPKISGPPTVTAALVDGDYLLTDKQGRALFTGTCTKDCRWVPLQAGAVRYGIGDWTVDRSGDTPQWVYRGKRVFVSQEDDPLQAPASATVLRP